MLTTKGNTWGFRVSNIGTPNTSPGTSITPGATNAEGTYTQVLSALAQDCYWFEIAIAGGNTSAGDKSHLLDIGVDPAGGTSWISLIQNICCGSSAPWVSGAYFYCFPLHIKSGSTVAVRIQGSNGTAGTVRVAVTAFGKPSKPEMIQYSSYAETIGAITNSGGVSVTAGTSAAEGTWTSLGTTTKDLWWWQLTAQISNGTITSLAYYFDMAHGDANNKHIIAQDIQMFIPGTAEQLSLAPQFWGYHEVKGGDTIYVRASCSGTPVTGINCTAIGMG